SYLFGSAVSRLFYGPLSDRFGRRPVMLGGAIILIAGAVICLLSFNIWPLIAGRLVQGIGACAGGVIADAAVRDAFAADRRQTIYARITAVFALAPAAGPIAGIYLTQWLGWHANFGLLVLLSGMLWVLVWRYLPETHVERDPQALEGARLRQHAWQALTTRGFVLYASLGGFCVGVVYTALIGAPDLVLNVLKGGNTEIMIVSLAILLAFVIGAGMGALVSKKMPPDLFIGAGLTLLLAASAWLMLVALLIGKQGSLATFLFPIGVCFIGVGMVVPVATARAMAPFDQNSGIASSLLGSIQMLVAALGTLVMGLLHAGAVVDIPIVFLALAGSACVALLGHVARRFLHFPQAA
ncbi:MAG: Bcr/CflA family efflux MFS transporter, partial [Rhodanobacter sp.]